MDTGQAGPVLGSLMMSDKSNSCCVVSGFLPGLVLGVIVGAATAFVALEVLDSPKMNIEPNLNAAVGERGERDDRGGRDAERGAERIEDAASDKAEELIDDAAEKAKELVDPAVDPGDG